MLFVDLARAIFFSSHLKISRVQNDSNTGEFEKSMPYKRVHFWHFALQKGAFFGHKIVLQ